MNTLTGDIFLPGHHLVFDSTVALSVASNIEVFSVFPVHLQVQEFIIKSTIHCFLIGYMLKEMIDSGSTLYGCFLGISNVSG